MALPQDLPPLPLPDGVRSAYVKGVNGLDMHYLEAGKPSRPLILLLHGFPELAFSWRNLMVPLAEQGFHVIAPDQRGYGRTTGWSEAYDQDLFTSRMPTTTSTRTTTVLDPTPMRAPSPTSVLSNDPRGAVDDLSNDANDARDDRLARTADAGAVCRICLDAHDHACKSPHTIDDDDVDAHTLITLGCACRGDVALAHKSCASRWFAPLARGCARGAALSPDWTLVWRVTCEVCGVDVSPELTHDVVKACKRALRHASSSSLV